jgi:prepilin peptidase CpaA
MSFTAIVILTVFPVCMLFATFYDIFTMTIPNKISLVLIAAFAICAPLAGISITTALWSVGLALFVLSVGFALFSAGIMGGGDVKLLAASTLWFGTAFTLPYLLFGAILGGLLTIAIVLYRRLPMLPLFALRFPWMERLHDKNQGVPYGAALGPAAITVFATSGWMDFILAGTPIG